MHIELQKVIAESELATILQIQKEAFNRLFQSYGDEGSPFLEGFEDLRRRFHQDNSSYFFILSESKTIGFVRVVCDDETKAARISPIAILPTAQGKGVGRKVMLQVEALHPHIRRWHLDTLKQEAQLVRFYESVGYQRTTEEIAIQPGMDLVMMTKVRKSNK